MEDGADLSGTESDVTVVLEYSDVVGEADTAWPQAEHTQPDCECPFIEAGTAEGDTIDTLLDVDSNNSEISLDFGSDSEEVGVGTGVQIQTEAAPPKAIYKSIGFYNSMDEADRALHGFNRFVYTYRTRYLSPFVLGKVYQCRSHIGCDHRLKLATHRVDENTFRYQLLQRGKHSGTNIQLPARGISPVLKPELDALLKLGMSAGRVRNMLLFKYIREPDMLAHVPDVRKMENRKAYLKKKVTGGWEINKFIALRNWSALRMCQDRATFLSVDVDNFSDMNSMIVLHDFEHTVNVNEQQVESMGLIVTTRALFKNICRAVQDRGSTLVMSTDGTYKFHFGGWTLVDCGGISVESTDVGFVHRFRPWLYMFVRTESKFAYEQLFRTLVKYAREFYDIDVSIRSASIDHADSIASALVSVWPQIEILTCWEHLLRQSRKQSKLANESTFIKEWVQTHLRLLHASRSLKQFRGLSKRILQTWREHGEESLANWLESVYLKPRWERWSVGSASVPGFLPTQQPIESHHRVIKVIVTDFKKAPTISVLNSVLPRVLLYDATNLSSVTQGHYAEGPLPLGAVMKAKSFLLDPQNHRIVPTKATQRPARIFFNTSKSMVQPKNMAGSPVTAARTERFQRSLRGWLGGEVPVADIQFTFLSLHQVTLHDLHLSQIEDLQLQSRWRFPEIVSIRRAMSCTCKRFKHSGWVCSHIIASLHLLDKLNIERALETIPMRGPPGRPRSTRGGLHRDDTCAVDRLIEVFTKNPGRALKWPVVEEFEVVDDGVAVPDRRIGQVAACRLSPHDGVYIWTATFVDGDTAEYKVEELVHAIRRARDMSASV